MQSKGRRRRCRRICGRPSARRRISIECRPRERPRPRLGGALSRRWGDPEDAVEDTPLVPRSVVSGVREGSETTILPGRTRRRPSSDEGGASDRSDGSITPHRSRGGGLADTRFPAPHRAECRGAATRSMVSTTKSRVASKSSRSSREIGSGPKGGRGQKDILKVTVKRDSVSPSRGSGGSRFSRCPASTTSRKTRRPISVYAGNTMSSCFKGDFVEARGTSTSN